MDSGTLVILVLLVLTVGTPLLLIAFGLVRLATSRRFIRRAARANALVIDLTTRQEMIPIANGGMILNQIFEPVVRFQTPNAGVVEARVEIATAKPTVHIGQTTEVLYDPARPQRVRLAEADGTGQGRRLAIGGCIVAVALPLLLACGGSIIARLLTSP